MKRLKIKISEFGKVTDKFSVDDLDDFDPTYIELKRKFGGKKRK